MEICCAFAPVMDTPDHIALAEELGYRRAWAFDTPAVQLDAYATLAVAAVKTSRIELGPGVIIPSLRHVMATASAIATLVGTGARSYQHRPGYRVFGPVGDGPETQQMGSCLSMKLSKAAETQRMSHRGFQSLCHIRVRTVQLPPTAL